jgi:hypothetical protein
MTKVTLGARYKNTDACEHDRNSLNDEEHKQQVRDDLYDGLKEEVEAAVQMLRGGGWPPYKVLNEALVEGMRSRSGDPPSLAHRHGRAADASAESCPCR